MLFILLKFLFYNILLFSFLYIIIKLTQYRLKKHHIKKYGTNLKILTFIHPNCYDFGGGEKVLWMIISALTAMKKSSSLYKINILSAPKINKTPSETSNPLSYNETLLLRLKERFSLTIQEKSEAIKEIEMIEFKSAKYLSPFPYFTMLLQIIFQMIFAFEICIRVTSDNMIDTTG